MKAGKCIALGKSRLTFYVLLPQFLGLTFKASDRIANWGTAPWVPQISKEVALHIHTGWSLVNR